MSQAVGSNVDGTFGNNDWLKNTIPFVPPSMQKPFVVKNPIESQQKLALEKAKLEEEKAMFDAQKKQQNNTKEPIYYILVTAGVLVVGYFAYKKFKK